MVSSRPFGLVNGKTVTAYTIENKTHTRLTVIDYGARIASLILTDGREVVLGFDSAEGYAQDNASIGAVCGRYANRISNACFTLNGIEYMLDKNDGQNTLHGGKDGFAYRMFTAKTEENAVILTFVSPDGDMGFPGELTLTVRYDLTENALRIKYSAQSNRDTVINITNHTYFNLAGCGRIFDHKLRVNAHLYTPSDEELMPTGEFLDVTGTPLDLRENVRLGDWLDPLDPFLEEHLGYDNSYVVDRKERDVLEYAATLTAPDGLMMDCFTTEPCIHIYTANYLNDDNGRGGMKYEPLTAVCLETQHFPDAMKHPHFPSPILRTGNTYFSETEYRFHY